MSVLFSSISRVCSKCSNVETEGEIIEYRGWVNFTVTYMQFIV